MNPIVLKEKISEFLKEDLGFGDLSVAFLPGGTPPIWIIYRQAEWHYLRSRNSPGNL